MKTVRKIFSKIEKGLLVAGLFSIVLSMDVFAKTGELCSLECPVNRSCGMDYDFNYETFPISYAFSPVKDNVAVKEQPYKEATIVDIYNYSDTIYIDGIIRNDKENLWLHVEDTGWVYIDNVSYLFEKNVSNFYDIVTNEGDANWSETLLSFYHTVERNGIADIKVWLDPGSKGITYNVDMNNACYTFSAETIGNLNFGYLGNMIDISKKVLLFAGGFVNVYERIDNGTLDFDTLVDIADSCANYYCDTKEDGEAVEIGFDQYDALFEMDEERPESITLPTFDSRNTNGLFFEK